jgi:CNT family concentrative nucleoside transporter
MERLTSLAGLLILLALAWILSEKRSRIAWPGIAGAVVLMLALGAAVFLAPQSTEFFLVLNRVVLRLLRLSRDGAVYLFGPLALAPGESGPSGEQSFGFFMAFQIFPALVFFSALMSLLYHARLIQPVVRVFARVFKRSSRLSGAEALCSASNIFVGIEAVFTIRPYLERLTRSEYFLILTASMATTASTTLAIYVAFLQSTLPTIAGHLISASVLAIPASVAVAKIMVPETAVPVTLGHLPRETDSRHSNFMGAVSDGAWEGIKLAAGIGALLIAVLGLVGMVNVILQKGGFTLETLLAWLMIPFAWCLGIAPGDIFPAARLLGERWILTEVVAYRDLAAFAAQGLIRDPRTIVVMSYALCGFTHVASVAIFVGGISALVPSRRDEIAALGMKALLAAFLATLATGCVAGIFFRQGAAVLIR